MVAFSRQVKPIDSSRVLLRSGSGSSPGDQIPRSQDKEWECDGAIESFRDRNATRSVMLVKCVLIVAASVLRGAWAQEDELKFAEQPGPTVRATKGGVWPKPQEKITTEEFFIVRSNFFQFKLVGETCDILEKALQRYKQDLRMHDRLRSSTKAHVSNETPRQVLIVDKNFKGFLDELTVNLRYPCESMPHADMDEHYELRINSEDFPNSAYLISQSIWGILRGLETWSQLIYSSPDYKALLVNSTSIMDFPRFPHRGLLIDTARHFLPMRIIYIMLDAMASSKMNVLHWHAVDDQSFPFQSQRFPNLSLKGAYAPTHVYTPQDVQSIIAYAADRGIRVIPEFDTPGHTRSWGAGYPELLTECYENGEPDGNLGPMNPIAPGTYTFMEEFLMEINETFPDSYIHLGGDEVPIKCWVSNPEIQEYLKERGMHPGKLQDMYITKIIEMSTNLSLSSVVWQEVFDNGAPIPNDTVVHIWKPHYQQELYDVTKKGYRVLLSSCWYLDHLFSGGNWHRLYDCDPQYFTGSDHQKRLVIGGEACMWSEVVDVNNVVSRVWPRACAVAERLWSSEGTTNKGEAARRLEEHVCRMNRRKISAQPANGAGFCPGLNYI